MKAISYRDSLFRGNIYRSMDIAGAGMTAQRQRLDAISSNIANMSVTNVDGNGSPYLRRQVIMRPDPDTSFAGSLREATMRLIRTDPAHMKERGISERRDLPPLVAGETRELPNERKNVVYDPTHPDADAEGFVVYPDVDFMEEMVDLTVAGRAFEANVTVMNAAKQMITRSLDI